MPFLFAWKNRNFYLMLLGDFFLVSISLLLAYAFRFDLTLPEEYWAQILILWSLFTPLKLTAFMSFGLYRGMWRYTSLEDLWRLMAASLTAQVLVIALVGYWFRFQGYPRSVFFLDWILTVVLTAGYRIGIRSYYSGQWAAFDWKNLFSLSRSKQGQPVLIVGAGKAGERVSREILERPTAYRLVGFVDDAPGKQNRLLHNVPVLGRIEDLPELCVHYQVGLVVVAIPSAMGDQMKRIVELCKQAQVEFKILPGLSELIDGRVSIKKLRDVDYGDLLPRKEVHLDLPGIATYLQDKVVLVTGAGGSIGSQLCRQLTRFAPGELLLLDSSEANLYGIEMELRHELGTANILPILGRCQDQRLLSKVFGDHRPQVIFHAAAYKHVPMLELNPWEAVTNNILGTQVLLETAVKYKSERFVLVSTDKAVRPTNVMGASKRVTELLMLKYAGQGMRLMAVRFGNVLGSSGSVIPLFRRQIEKGGPVTVTHPEVTRYFMTIEEAAQLILQAGSMGQNAEIFILKMGTPVRIADMAQDLIRLSGKEPGKDIQIVFTGLRPGEKLYEELITQGEGIVQTIHDQIMVVKDEKRVQDFAAWLDAHLARLLELALAHDGEGIKKVLKELLPEYQPGQSQT